LDNYIIKKPAPFFEAGFSISFNKNLNNQASASRHTGSSGCFGHTRDLIICNFIYFHVLKLFAKVILNCSFVKSLFIKNN